MDLQATSNQGSKLLEGPQPAPAAATVPLVVGLLASGRQEPAAPMTDWEVSAARRRIKPPKLYRIGEVVEYSGMSRQTIHNYTTMGLLRENRRTGSGHRLYDEAVFERLDMIAELRSRNVPLGDIRERLSAMDGP
jgi:hypothetical protein